jgi:hypothetical protein
VAELSELFERGAYHASQRTRARSASKRDFFIADILRWALKDDRLHGASFFSLSKKAGLSDTSSRT